MATTFDPHDNLATSTVATAPSPATTGESLVVAAGQGARFPASGSFNATIHEDGQLPSPANAEIVRVTAVSTDTLTITRAQEGTTARTVVVGDRITLTVTEKSLTDIEGALNTAENDIDAVEATLATHGTIVTSNTGDFDAAGTAAALVDDLSGVSDAATARTNLGLGTAATSATTDFATGAEGDLAATAVQPADLDDYSILAGQVFS